MDKLQLKASSRDVKATNPNSLRKQGLVPAVLYGHNSPNVALAVNLNEFEKTLKKAGESTVIDLQTEDGKSHPVLIHEIQTHFLTSAPQHIDFYEVNLTEKLRAKVVLEFTGEAKAVKELGGVLVKVLNEVEVQCLPNDLPHNISVDVSTLNNFSDVIHIADLKVPNKVQMITPLNEVVVKVQPPRDIEAELAVPLEEKVEEVIAASTEAPAAAEGAKTTEEVKPAPKEETKSKKE